MALEWINSFLTNRILAVVFRLPTCDVVLHSATTWFVVRPSVLGLLLFLLYTADVAIITHGYVCEQSNEVESRYMYV